MLVEFATTSVFHFLLIFARLGATMVSLPGFGEIHVSPRIRLTIALVISLALLPMLKPLLPSPPGSPFALFILLLGESLIGFFIGGIARMIQGTLHIAGMIIAFQSSLAAAVVFDPTQGSQGSVFGTFMTLLGLVILFTADLHHVLLLAIVHSYDAISPGVFPPVSDFATMAPVVMSKIFLVAVQIAAPLIIVGLLIYLAAGLMSRLMPTMPVFFVIIPAQILASFYVLLLTLSAGMLWYMEHFRDTIEGMF